MVKSVAEEAACVRGVTVRQAACGQRDNGGQEGGRHHGSVSAPRRETPHLDCQEGTSGPGPGAEGAGPFLRAACSLLWCKQADRQMLHETPLAPQGPLGRGGEVSLPEAALGRAAPTPRGERGAVEALRGPGSIAQRQPQ